MAKRKATNPEIWERIKGQAEREGADPYDMLKEYLRLTRWGQDRHAMKERIDDKTAH